MTETLEAPPGVEIESKLDKLSKSVAENIGGDVTPERVKRVINASNEKGFIMHGVKANSLTQQVREVGVRPVTPEGGMVSYWTSGTNTFGSLRGNGQIDTYDTAFFHYAHSYDADPDKKYMTLAVASADTMHRPFPENGYITIKEAVPREAIEVLRVEIDRSETQLDARAVGQRGEQALFNLLERTVTGEFTPGGEKVEQIKV